MLGGAQLQRNGASKMHRDSKPMKEYADGHARNHQSVPPQKDTVRNAVRRAARGYAPDARRQPRLARRICQAQSLFSFGRKRRTKRYHAVCAPFRRRVPQSVRASRYARHERQRVRLMKAGAIGAGGALTSISAWACS